MKRWVTLLLATVVLLMAAGCGEKAEKLPAASLENPQITASQSDTSSPSTAAPADTPEAEASRIPAITMNVWTVRRMKRQTMPVPRWSIM